MNRSRSDKLFRMAKNYIPGGVNSPVRSWKAVGGVPLFIKSGKGCIVWDVDDNQFIDFVGSWGPLIHGHAHPAILPRIHEAITRGTGFGAPTEVETKLAEKIVKAVPSIEMVRFVNSGTEATMSAIRLARAYTGKGKVIKFSGGYHGHSDGLLVKGNSSLVGDSIPDSTGIPNSFVKETLIAEYNDLSMVEELFQLHGRSIACVIVEPVAGNMGVIPPDKGFLEGLRKLTLDNDSLLVFDEVITGFRVAYGGAQSFYGVKPDITCLGKIIGGGLPVGCYGASKDIMRLVSPLGQVYQAGTLSGNPVAMTAGIATLELLQEPGVYQQLELNGSKLSKVFLDAFSKIEKNVVVNRVGSMMTLFITDQELVKDWTTAGRCDMRAYGDFFHRMLKFGVYMPPSPLEALFISTTHSDEHIDQVAEAIYRAVEVLR
ncbi:MAG: glutamate-1-semialdehyde-2,1-aminomutase [Dehalococcoidia bacterium]|nr:glutamate-1-semialdehyde-2,1-aminomutase [Dehalococcoidia bacterium]|tara:strand:+ start:441 stop:1730 length:1290 start_codon:yes stop_codon:yes gene_type:complete